MALSPNAIMSQAGYHKVVSWTLCSSLSILTTCQSSTYLFADDTKFFREIREENDEKMLQADLDSLQSWSDTWLLKFHPNKCKVMSVANKCVDKGTKHYYLYNNDGNRIELEQSDGEKDIRVLVDENLSFNKHIQNQVNKANSIM
jgi:hypothetical protein